MSFMIAFSLAGVMLCIGMFLRSKVHIFQSMLVPSSVIGGVAGILFMNAVNAMGVNMGTDQTMYTEIVNHLFTISFISISLTSTPKSEGNGAQNVFRGALGMGLVWCLLYALTPIIATAIIAALGQHIGMEPVYGMLIQFAFCQGPGQSAAYGAIFEQYGWENASTVAIAFSSIGFIAAFLAGIPAAKSGIKRGIAKKCGELDTAVLKGYYVKSEQNEYMVKDTTCNSNIETWLSILH